MVRLINLQLQRYANCVLHILVIIDKLNSHNNSDESEDAHSAP